MGPCFEIHACVSPAPPGSQSSFHPPLVIDGAPSSPAWVAADDRSGALLMTPSEHEADAGFLPVQDGRRAFLVLLPRRASVLVNGIATLPLSFLVAKDTIVLRPGSLAYITQRVRRHAGPPPPELLGVPCKFCTVPFTPETLLVQCCPGTAYHVESAASHPHLPEEQRLGCFHRLKQCLKCGAPLSLEDHLVWNVQESGL